MLSLKDFLDHLAKTSRYDFQLWTAEKDLIFSSKPVPAKGALRGQLKDFSDLVLSRQTFQHQVHQTYGAMYGLALKNGMDVVGALTAYFPNSGRQGRPQAEGAAGLPEAGEMQTFLTHLAQVIDFQFSSQTETEKLTEELSQTFEDLVLFSRIGVQTRPLNFSGKMLFDLIENLLEIMRADLAFAWLPKQSDYSAVVMDNQFPPPKAEVHLFVQALADRIPPEVVSNKEECFIVENSADTPGFMKLHPSPFRFLAVMIETNDRLYGWMGVVSFNLDEIFRQSELKLLNSLASSTAVAIENSRLFSESVQMAQKERSVRNIFQKYVPKAVANEILDRGDSDLITLGEKRLVTLLNVDMRGYSHISKKLRSEDVVSVLNHFFMTMGSAVLNHRGILDKYLGDGILAVFGAPVASKNPSLDAVLAALEMRERVKAFNAFTREHYGVSLDMGVSINTGEAIMGNIGFESKMEYTVIGDVVNETFHLQDLTRERPNSILVSKTAYQKIKPYVLSRPLGMQKLRSGESRMKVYEVLDRKKGPAET